MVDLDNLTKEDFVEIAKYCNHLEEQVKELKAYAITLATQRNQEHQRYLQAKAELNNKINTIDIVHTTLDLKA